MKRTTKIVYMFAALFFIIIAIITIRIFTQPEKSTEKSTDNNITQYTRFEYIPEVAPFTLNPIGGVSQVQGAMFLKVTKTLRINLETNIKSVKPITIDGYRTVTLSIVSEDLWEDKRVLDEKKEIKLDNQQDYIINGSFQIDLKQISDFIANVEKDTDVRPNKYILVIKPVYEGNIEYNGKPIPFDSSPVLKFEIYNGRITATKPVYSTSAENMASTVDSAGIDGDSVTVSNITSQPEPNVFEFKSESTVTNTTETVNQFNLGIIKMDIGLAKWIFIPILIILIFILLFIPIKRYRFVGSLMSESQMIDKKLGSRMVDLKKDITETDKLIIDVNTFKSLLSVAQQKDLQLLRFEDISNNTVIYYIIDLECIYRYKTLKAHEGIQTAES